MGWLLFVKRWQVFVMMNTAMLVCLLVLQDYPIQYMMISLIIILYGIPLAYMMAISKKLIQRLRLLLAYLLLIFSFYLSLFPTISFLNHFLVTASLAIFLYYGAKLFRDQEEANGLTKTSWVIIILSILVAHVGFHYIHGRLRRIYTRNQKNTPQQH